MVILFLERLFFVCFRYVPLVLADAVQPRLRDGAEALQEVVPAFFRESVFLARVALVLQLLPLHLEAHGHLTVQRRKPVGLTTFVISTFFNALKTKSKTKKGVQDEPSGMLAETYGSAEEFPPDLVSSVLEKKIEVLPLLSPVLRGYSFGVVESLVSEGDHVLCVWMGRRE